MAACTTRLIARVTTQRIENEDSKTCWARMTLIIFEFFNVHAMYVASLSCLCLLRDGRRALSWILVTMYCTLCPFSNVTLCLTPSFIGIWLAVSLVYLPLIADTLSRPLKRGRSVVVSKRNFASLLSTATQSSNRLQKVPTRSRPMCSQTKTSSLSVLNVSDARVFFKPSIIGKEAAECTTSSFQNVMKCDVDVRVIFLFQCRVVKQHHHVPRDW